MHKHLLLGLKGLSLSAWEKQALREFPPRGVILFGRNTESSAQVRALLDEVRQTCGEAIWVAVDEEGGRVNRMPWPPFKQRKPAQAYGRMMSADADAAWQAVYEENLLVGKALTELGFTHNCAPVLDLLHPEGHGIIGERAYGADVPTVSHLASACRQGLRDGGIAAVGKHFPGHGRANADSHLAVPLVDAPLETLLQEAQGFLQLIEAGLEHVMTAHVVYSQVDEKVATLSPYWLQDILRKRFGFAGSIWSDDLSMKGVGDDVCVAAKAALAAGCDVLPVCEPADVHRIYEALSAGMLGSGT